MLSFFLWNVEKNKSNFVCIQQCIPEYTLACVAPVDGALPARHIVDALQARGQRHLTQHRHTVPTRRQECLTVEKIS